MKHQPNRHTRANKRAKSFFIRGEKTRALVEEQVSKVEQHWQESAILAQFLALLSPTMPLSSNLFKYDANKDSFILSQQIDSLDEPDIPDAIQLICHALKKQNMILKVDKSIADERQEKRGVFETEEYWSKPITETEKVVDKRDGRVTGKTYERVVVPAQPYEQTVKVGEKTVTTGRTYQFNLELPTNTLKEYLQQTIGKKAVKAIIAASEPNIDWVRSITEHKSWNKTKGRQT